MTHSIILVPILTTGIVQGLLPALLSSQGLGTGRGASGGPPCGLWDQHSGQISHLLQLWAAKSLGKGSRRASYSENFPRLTGQSTRVSSKAGCPLETANSSQSFDTFFFSGMLLFRGARPPVENAQAPSRHPQDDKHPVTQRLTFLMRTGDGSANKCVLVQYKAIVKSWKEWRARGGE